MCAPLLFFFWIDDERKRRRRENPPKKKETQKKWRKKNKQTKKKTKKKIFFFLTFFFLFLLLLPTKKKIRFHNRRTKRPKSPFFFRGVGLVFFLFVGRSAAFPFSSSGSNPKKKNKNIFSYMPKPPGARSDRSDLHEQQHTGPFSCAHPFASDKSCSRRPPKGLWFCHMHKPDVIPGFEQMNLQPFTTIPLIKKYYCPDTRCGERSTRLRLLHALCPWAFACGTGKDHIDTSTGGCGACARAFTRKRWSPLQPKKDFHRVEVVWLLWKLRHHIQFVPSDFRLWSGPDRQVVLCPKTAALAGFTLPRLSTTLLPLGKTRANPFTTTRLESVVAPECFVIGDLHGDPRALARSLLAAGVLPSDFRLWTPAEDQNDGSAQTLLARLHWRRGCRAHVVLAGDVCDNRREHNNAERRLTEPFDRQAELPLVRAVLRLSEEAETQGGRLVWVIGNHDYHNVFSVGPASSRRGRPVAWRREEAAKDVREWCSRFTPKGVDLCTPERREELLAAFQNTEVVHVLPNGALVAHGGLSSRWLGQQMAEQQVGGEKKKTEQVGGGAVPCWTATAAERVNAEWRRFVAAAGAEENPVGANMEDDRSPIWFRPTLDSTAFAQDVRFGAEVPFCVVAHTPQENGFGFRYLVSPNRKLRPRPKSEFGLELKRWYSPPVGAQSCTVGVDFTLSRAFGSERLRQFQAILGVGRHLPIFQFLPLAN